MSLSTAEAARVQLRAGTAGRKTAPARPPWCPPILHDFLPRTVIAAFDASLTNTGWSAFRSLGQAIEVLGHGTIKPVTTAVSYMSTWEKARQLEEALWEEGIVMRFFKDPEVLLAVEAPPVGGGHRTESSLIAGLAVWRMAPRRVIPVSATHVSAVLLGQPGIPSRDRKKAIKAAVARYVPESAGRGWDEHQRDSLSVGLTRLFDLKEAAGEQDSQ